MSKAKLDGEGLVRDYLTRMGLHVDRFSESEKQGTPSFRVFVNGELVFYCKVVTAQKHEWPDGFGPDPNYNEMTNNIQAAVKQFDAVNPAVDYPNLLAIVNGDEDSGLGYLYSVLTGYPDCEGGTLIPMFREYSDDLSGEHLRVHLYLWFAEREPDRPQFLFSGVHVTHHAALCRYFKVDPTAVKRLPI